jgi:excisionase family DNA binding protein
MPATLELLTAEELATILKVSANTIREWARRGRIPCVWASSRVRRFVLEDVRAALKDSRPE